MGKSLVTANKGEWGELYAKCMFLTEGYFYDFIQGEKKYFKSLLHDGEYRSPIERESSLYLEAKDLLNASHKLCLKRKKTFENPYLLELCEKLGLPPTKVGSDKKADLILSNKLGINCVYFVESLVSSKASIINASPNIRYTISGPIIDKEYLLEKHGKGKEHPKLKRVTLPGLLADGYNLIFRDIPDENFLSRLKDFNIERELPKILLTYYTSRRKEKIEDIFNLCQIKYPDIGKRVKDRFCSYAKSCLYEGSPRALSKESDGSQAGSGLILITRKGECVLINAEASNWWEIQIKKFSNFDVPAQGRHNFGYAYLHERDVCMDLCLGLRVKFNPKDMIPTPTPPPSTKKVKQKSTKKQPENLDSPEDFIKSLKL
jgi:hypothetical protein